MVSDQAALTIADLCNNFGTESHHIEDIDELSTLDHSTIDNSTIGYDDDSFIANSSLCKEHRSTIHMLNSLRREVVEMTRSDDQYLTPKKSPQEVTIDMSRGTDLSSPLVSPLLARTTVSLSNKNNILPSLSNHRVTPNGSENYPRHLKNSDDSTFCSMDNSIQNEMNVLKEVVKDLERELKAENLDTVFEAIERIGKSDDPIIKSLFGAEDKGASGKMSKGQSHEHVLFRYELLDSMRFLRIIWNCSMNVKILIASIVICLIRKYFM